jgi:hypothetical protein
VRSTGVDPCALVLSALLAAQPVAAAAAQEAAALGGPALTPLGAERPGNANGTIPPWTGGITEPPAGYEKGHRHPDPYPDDSVVLTITAANLDEHAGRLSAGQQALLRAFPDTWRMYVYPTRRSASFPDFVYQAVDANARNAQLVTEGKGGVLGATVGSPFPVPRSGIEVVWNHNLRWRGIRIQRTEGVAAVTQRGNYRVVLSEQDIGIPYASPRESAFKRKYPNLMLLLKSKTINPQLRSGDGVLVAEPIDQTDDPRKSWFYNRDLRRVVRRPRFGYDFPALNSDGIRTVDDFGLFNGPPDRFEWTLVGKREIYIPYNAYRLHGSDVGPAEILQKRHIAPELARYELHRVWVVEGRLRPGSRHIYSRRVFYVDEDSWQIALSESYDSDGKLWRVAEAHAVNYYEVPALWTTVEVFYDLRDGRYFANGLDNDRNCYRFSDTADPREFSPNALLDYVR